MFLEAGVPGEVDCVRENFQQRHGSSEEKIDTDCVSLKLRACVLVCFLQNDGARLAETRDASKLVLNFELAYSTRSRL